MSRTFAKATLAASALLAFGLSAGAAEMKIAGTMNAGVVQQEALPLGAPDHVAVLMLHKGTTASAGSPLDGAALELSETVLLDKGNGPETGAITMANDKGSLTSEIHGTVKTEMVDGQPRVSVSGTYKMIAGTGVFAGGTGHGTYAVTFTSKTDWKGEYHGVLALPRRQAAR